jgi:hypothetical protein
MRRDQRVPEHPLPDPNLKLLDLLANVLEVSSGDPAAKVSVRPRPHERPAARLAVPLVQALVSIDRALTSAAQPLGSWKLVAGSWKLVAGSH